MPDTTFTKQDAAKILKPWLAKNYSRQPVFGILSDRIPEYDPISKLWVVQIRVEFDSAFDKHLFMVWSNGTVKEYS